MILKPFADEPLKLPAGILFGLMVRAQRMKLATNNLGFCDPLAEDFWTRD